MKKYKIVTYVGIGIMLAATSFAGFYRVKGKTMWQAGYPSPLSLWQRDINDELYMTAHPWVFEDTMRWYDGTNAIYGQGVWVLDSNSDIYMNSLAESALMTAQFNPWYDVEWLVDTNGDAYARE